MIKLNTGILRTKLGFEPTRDNIVNNIQLISNEFNIDKEFMTISSDKIMIKWSKELKIINEFDGKTNNIKRCSVYALSSILKVNITSLDENFIISNIDQIIKKFSLKEDEKFLIYNKNEIITINTKGEIINKEESSRHFTVSNQINLYLDGYITLNAEFNIIGIGENNIKNRIQNNQIIFEKNKIYSGDDNNNIQVSIKCVEEFELFAIAIKNNDLLFIKKLKNGDNILSIV